MSSRRRRSSHRTPGQALVEFAIVLPMFLTLFLGAIDLGRVIWAGDSLAAAAREAARFAIVHGGSPATACPVGPPGKDAVIPLASSSCPHPSPSKESIRDVARTMATAGGETLVVTVCYGAGCTGDTDATGATNDRRTPLTVVVTSRVSLVIPALLGFTSFDVKGSSTMLVNH